MAICKALCNAYAVCCSVRFIIFLEMKWAKGITNSSKAQFRKVTTTSSDQVSLYRGSSTLL